MADWTKVIIDIDGNPQSVELPTYAKESTQEEIVKALEKLGSSLDVKGLQFGLEQAAKNNETVIKKTMDRVADEIKTNNEKIRKSYEVAGGEFGGSV